ncbi:MAG: HD domain-containing protein [Pseudomonadota bacterium]
MASIRLPTGERITFDRAKKRERLFDDIVKSAEFQRLTHVRELGFSYKSYPGAVHNRLEHSLGVFQKACVFADRVRDEFRQYYDKERAFEFKLQALLHDLGHGPHSHTFEVAAKAAELDIDHHEKWTSRIILGDTEIGRLLQEYDDSNGKDLRKRLGDYFSSPDSDRTRDFWDSMISGQFDVDRLDYIVRDAFHSGVSVGANPEYLLRKTQIIDVDGTPCVAFDIEAREELTSFLDARVKIYNRVAHDPIGNACDTLFAEICKQVKEALRDCSPEILGLSSRNAFVELLNHAGRIPLEMYLRTNDNQMNVFLDDVVAANHAVLQRASQRARKIKSGTPLEVINFERIVPNYSQAQYEEADALFQCIADDVNGGSIAFAEVYRKAAYKEGQPVLQRILISTEVGAKELTEFDGAIPRDLRHAHFYSENPEVMQRFKQHFSPAA